MPPFLPVVRPMRSTGRDYWSNRDLSATPSREELDQGPRECVEPLFRVREQLAERVGCGSRDLDLTPLPSRYGLLPDAEHVGDLVGAEPDELAHELELHAGANPAGDQSLRGEPLLPSALGQLDEDLAA